MTTIASIGRAQAATRAFALGLVMWVGLANGQASIQMVVSNGPAASRFNIVVLSEGYTSGQLASFPHQTSNIVSAVLQRPPFAEYQTFFNVFAITVPSQQSGSDHPASGITVSSYFNSSYDRFDQIVTIPLTSQGQGKVDALLQAFLPETHLAIILVNDMIPAGSDGGGKSAVVSVGNSLAFMADILAHEVGHVMAGLGDEYESAFPGYPDVEEPNTTRETRRDFIRWKNWIAADTPVPTPPWLEYDDKVGLFEGAHYHSTGWYRPRLNCAMRDNVSPFCEVCSQSLVLALHARVPLVAGSAPAATNLLVSTGEPLHFKVDLLRPTTHDLDVQWFTNGIPAPGSGDGGFLVWPGTLREGSNSVSVVVADNTPLVRDDALGVLRETNTWTVTVSIPRLHLGSPFLHSDGKFSFLVQGVAQNGFVLETSTNLLDWAPVSTNFLVNGSLWCTNSPLPLGEPHFYRAVVR